MTAINSKIQIYALDGHIISGLLKLFIHVYEEEERTIVNRVLLIIIPVFLMTKYNHRSDEFTWITYDRFTVHILTYIINQIFHLTFCSTQ